MTRSVGIPQARAAVSFDPIAKTRRPKTVRESTTATAAASRIAIQTPGASSIHGRSGEVVARSFNQVAGVFTVCSLATHFAAPRAMPSIPSVAMKGTTRRRVIARPLMRPTTPPTAIPASRAAAGAQEDESAIAETTPERATTDPTERSIPPLTMMTVIPIAPKATMTVCVSTIRRLPAERDRGTPSRLGHAEPTAASRTDSGDQSEIGRAGESLPRDMTARRSHIPKSSGR